MTRSVSRFVLACAALLSLVGGVCFAESPLMTRHTREEVTSNLAPLVGHLPATQNLRIVLVLPHRNQPQLDQLLKDLYDRNNPNYRHFLTVEQFTERFGPSRQTYEAVRNWALQNGLQIKGTARNRMILPVSGSVQQIENALHVSMNVYQHPTEARTFFAPDREPMPDTPVRLWAIGGLDNFSRPVPMYSRRDHNAIPDSVISDATTGSGPQNSFLGSDMRAAYYTSTGGTLDGTGQSVGIFEFLGTDLADLTTYYNNVHQTNNVPITLDSVDGQNVNCTDNSSGGFCDDTEQTLDMTQALGMAPNMSSLVMYIGKGGLAGQTLDDPGILNAMATANPLNAQLSCSWEWRPTDNTTDDPFFQEFGAQGQNFFTASGDGGKWTAGIFVWPSDDPFLTSVGGTDLTTASAAGPWASETGWVDTGGGISPNNFAIPSWQVNAANGCTKCSKTLRNGPDVSANANFTFYVCADQTACTANEFGGTSFAAPMWAGFLALVNQQAVANGNPTLGFVNPALYNILGGSDYSADFHDITSGGNSLGSTVGYDLSTGIGSPNGQALVDDLAGPVSTGTFTLTAKPTSVTLTRGGAPGHVRLTTAVSGGFSSSISLSASGAPSGVKLAVRPATIAAPGSGNAAMTMAATATASTGTFTITITATGGSVTQTATVSVTVN